MGEHLSQHLLWDDVHKRTLFYDFRKIHQVSSLLLLYLYDCQRQAIII